MHGVTSEPFATGVARVKRCLSLVRPAEDRHQLVIGCSVFGGDGCPCLTQTMGGAVW